jgi:hypothetical protein
MLNGKHVLLILFSSAFLVSMIILLGVDALAQSPSFVREEFRDNRSDWGGENAEGPIDINEVSYFSDGKTLNFTLWFDILSENFDFNSTPLRYGMYIDVDNKNTTGWTPEGFDYGLALDKKNRTWITEFSEYPSPYVQVKTIRNATANTFGKADTGGADLGYAKLSLNLRDINYPKNYKVVLYARKHQEGDYTDWRLIPSPKVNFAFYPNPVEIAQGEEKNVEITLKSNAAIGSQIQIFSNESNGISTHYPSNTFHLAPNEFSLYQPPLRSQEVQR